MTHVAYESYDYLGPDCVTRYPTVIVFHPLGYPPVAMDVPDAVIKRRPDLAENPPAAVAAYLAVPEQARRIVIWDPVGERIITVNAVHSR